MKTEVISTLNAALAGEPATPLTRPWFGWLAVALCRQRLRQRWLMSIAPTVLDGSSSAGTVPGWPDWEYRFHGRGLLLCGPGNERLDVDFHPGDEDGATIDPYFFIHRVRSLSRPALPEQRLCAWMVSSTDLLMAALDTFRASGLIGHPSSSHVFRLSEPLEALCDSIGQVTFPPDRCQDWARRFGDDLSAEAPGRSAPFRSWVVGLLQDRKRAAVLKDLVGFVDGAALIEAGRRILAGPVDAAMGQSIEGLQAAGAMPDDDVPRLARRMDPAVHNPYAPCRLARWCLTSGVWREVSVDLIQRFAAQRQIKGFRGNPFDHDYALIALEFIPEMAPPLIAQALRSKTPLCFKFMAAYLSIVDEPWSTALLLAAAEESSEPVRTRFLVGCLQHVSDEQAVKRARAILPPPPDFSGETPGYSFEQVQFLNLREGVADQRRRAMETYRRLHPH
ncbi:MAG: hypothetical protein AAFV53_02355 [Myxococcota bacterium]